MYCDAEGVPLNIDHIVPRSRGGSDRITNLALACIPCNEEKGSRDIREFCPARATKILARAKAPLRAAAAMNSTRFATLTALRALALPVECSTGGRTKFNRHEHGIPKTHALDAACVGVLAGLTSWGGPTLAVKATGRGTHQRTRTDAYGFPRLRLPRSKRIRGFATGDLVAANVLRGQYAGRHTGRVAVRASGSFKVGSRDGIRYSRCSILQRADGYNYTSTDESKG